MVSWKTGLKEMGFYFYGGISLILLVLYIVVLNFVYGIEVVSFDTYIIIMLVVLVGLMVVTLALDVVSIKYNLKKRGK